MLINFAFENFRSFLNETILRMEAVKGQELPESIYSTPYGNLLPVAAIFGANSSGKSNSLKALKLMRDIVLNSDKLNPCDTLERDPYCLRLGSEEEPTSFEIQFVLKGSRYRYGFEYSEREIGVEWLFERRPKQKECRLFIRKSDEYEISKKRFREGIGKETFRPANRLFLSVVVQLNGTVSKSIIDWFSRIEYISTSNDLPPMGETLKMIYKNGLVAEEVMRLFTQMDLGFDSIEVLKSKEDGKFLVNTFHTVKDPEGNLVKRKSFPLEKIESEGTKRMIQIAGPVIDALSSGKILLIDDMDARLHPFLTLKIVSLFMNKKINKYGAQLLFTSHQTNLINLKFLRRDQIWFTEKDQTEASKLFSLAEFKSPIRKGVSVNNDFEKDYMAGRFGAIPLLK